MPTSELRVAHFFEMVARSLQVLVLVKRSDFAFRTGLTTVLEHPRTLVHHIKSLKTVLEHPRAP